MDCSEVIKQNLGLSRCKLPTMLKGMITLPAGTEITAANFQSLTAWRALLLNSYATRAYYWPPFRLTEDQGEAAAYELTKLSAMKVHDGNHRWRVFLKESLCLHKKLYTHNSEGDVDVILIDTENNFLATVADSGNIKGFGVDLINAEKLMLGDGSVSTKSPVFVALRDNTELDRQGIMYQNTFLSQLYRIVDVDLSVISYSGDDSMVVKVASACDGVGVQGLLLADFVYLDAGSIDVAPTSATPVSGSPGYYTIAKANAMVDGTINLRATDLLTVKAYESTGAVAVNVP